MLPMFAVEKIVGAPIFEPLVHNDVFIVPKTPLFEPLVHGAYFGLYITIYYY